MPGHLKMLEDAYRSMLGKVSFQETKTVSIGVYTGNEMAQRVTCLYFNYNT
jgi:hypothetical protein